MDPCQIDGVYEGGYLTNLNQISMVYLCRAASGYIGAPMVVGFLEELNQALTTLSFCSCK